MVEATLVIEGTINPEPKGFFRLTLVHKGLSSVNLKAMHSKICGDVNYM